MTYRSTFNGDFVLEVFVRCLCGILMSCNSQRAICVKILHHLILPERKNNTNKYLPLICLVANKKAKVIWGILFATDMRCSAWIAVVNFYCYWEKQRKSSCFIFNQIKCIINFFGIFNFYQQGKSYDYFHPWVLVLLSHEELKCNQFFS